MTHPLVTLIRAGLDGTFPAADGSWRQVSPWRDGVDAVVAFTGHAVLASEADLTPAVRTLVDGYGGAHHPRVLLELAGPGGWIDSLDALLVRRAAGGEARLVERPDLNGHPRVTFATRLRDDVRVLGTDDLEDRSVVTLGRGIAGLTEISVEIDPARRGRGQGADLIGAALHGLPREQIIVAAVAPGNAASLRAFLAAGFTVVGSVQLLRPQRTAAG